MLNVFKYFAKFPDKQGVLDRFHKVATERVAGYDDLKTYVTNLPAGLMKDNIKHFFFGLDDESLENAIKNKVDSYFLLVEHGQITTSDPDRANTRKTEHHLAVTIGHKVNTKNLDFIERAIIEDNCLDLIIQLARLIEEDDDSEAVCGNQEFIDSSLVFAPVEPTLLYGCFGYVMSFKKLDNTLL